jgi:iron complex outermembrane receptor protein
MAGRLKQYNSCDGGRSMENKTNRAALTLASAILGAAMFWAPAVAMAQSTTEADTAAAASAGDIEELVVTARRRSERRIDVPVAVTAVTVEQIRQYDLTEAANIKIVAPQITLDRGFTGAGASISMRGVSSSSLDAGVEQSVLLDFDGMAMSRGRILNDAMFDLEGIEVLKGPQALFFGKNSPGGVVSVRSADPTKEFSGYARAGYEVTARNPSVEAAISGPLSDTVGYRVAVYGSTSGGYITNTDPGVPDLERTAATGSTFVPPAQSRLGAEDKVGARLTLKYDDANKFDANFKLLVSEYRGQSLQSFDEVMACPAGRTHPIEPHGIIDPYGDCTLNDRGSMGWLSPNIINPWPQVKAHGDGRPYSSDETIMPTLTLNYRPSNFTLTSVTGYYDYSYVSQGDADNSAYSYFWSYSDEKNRSLYQELRAVSALDGIFNFAAGGHYEHNDRTLYVGGANGPVLLDASTGRYNSYDNQQHNKSDAGSIFGQLIVKFSNHVELTAGARYTRENKTLDSMNMYVNPHAAGFLPEGQLISGSRSESNTSPEATLAWHPTEQVMLYGAYKTGYLAGGFSNPGTLSSVSTIHTLTFSDETAKGVEAGIKASLLDHKLSGSITAFHYKYDGLPLTSLIALSSTVTTFVTQNAASTITQGIEFEGSYRPATGLTLSASASYDDAYFESFDDAQCYAGQTAAEGCMADPVTKAKTQNLTGAPVYRAPKWINTAGVAYEFGAVNNMHVTLNTDVRYTSGYYTGLNLNPLSYQGSFTLVNAGVRLSSADDKWSFAFIGRNLSNRRYGTLGVDKPGGLGEVFTVAGEPRILLLQAEARF